MGGKGALSRRHRGGGRWVAALVALAVAAAAAGAVGAQEEGLVPEGIIVQPEPHDLQVRIETDAGRYQIGDLVEIRFWVSHEAYVYVYNLDATGRVSLIFPNRYDRENRVGAGDHRLPGRGYVFKTRGPAGVEYLQIIATSEPIGFYEEGALSREAFPNLGSPGSVESRVRAELQVVPGRRWALDWTSYRVGSPEPPAPPPSWEMQGRLRVESSPSHASVYVDGSYEGRTPLTIRLDPGRYRVEVERDGYEPETEWVRVRANEESRLRVTLERESASSPAPPPPPPPTLPPPGGPASPPSPSPEPAEPREPIFYGGFDMGVGPDPEEPWRGNVFSFGGEFGGPFFGLGFSLRDTGDAVPPYDLADSPEKLAEETITLNEGPEAELYGRITLLRSGPLAVRTGIGLAWQKRATVPAVDVTDPTTPPDSGTGPHSLGYVTYRLYPATLIGAALEYPNGYVWAGYHLRRGLVVGAGFRF